MRLNTVFTAVGDLGAQHMLAIITPQQIQRRWKISSAPLWTEDEGYLLSHRCDFKEKNIHFYG